MNHQKAFICAKITVIKR